MHLHCYAALLTPVPLYCQHPYCFCAAQLDLRYEPLSPALISTTAAGCAALPCLRSLELTGLGLGLGLGAGQGLPEEAEEGEEAKEEGTPAGPFAHIGCRECRRWACALARLPPSLTSLHLGAVDEAGW